MAPLSSILAFALLPFLALSIPQGPPQGPFPTGPPGAPTVGGPTAPVVTPTAPATTSPATTAPATTPSATLPAGVSVVTYTLGGITTVFTYTVPTLPSGAPAAFENGLPVVPSFRRF